MGWRKIPKTRYSFPFFLPLFLHFHRDQHVSVESSLGAVIEEFLLVGFHLGTELEAGRGLEAGGRDWRQSGPMKGLHCKLIISGTEQV